MLLGPGTSNILQIVTSAAADVEVSASRVVIDTASPPVVDGTNTGQIVLASITSATTTTVVAGIASKTTRVDEIQCRNNHASTSCDVTFQRTDGTDTDTCYKATLLAGESVSYGGGMWVHYDSNGVPKLPSQVPDIQIFSTAGAQTWTKPTSFTPKVVIVGAIGAGGGGGGGGSLATAVVCKGGGGGGGGARVRGVFNAADLASTETVTIGAGGTAGTAAPSR